jgi:hypothetical protein
MFFSVQLFFTHLNLYSALLVINYHWLVIFIIFMQYVWSFHLKSSADREKFVGLPEVLAYRQNLLGLSVWNFANRHNYAGLSASKESQWNNGLRHTFSILSLRSQVGSYLVLYLLLELLWHCVVDRKVKISRDGASKAFKCFQNLK